MSTVLNGPNKCRWCGMFHGPVCSTVKAIEYHEDGITVRRVEFKTSADYYAVVSAPIVGPFTAGT